MKDSGIEWLGEIPKHWEITRLRFLLSKIEQGWSPSCHNYQAEEGEWGVLKVGCVNGAKFDPNENKLLPNDLEPKVQYEIIDGDILMSRANTKELLGSAALVINPRKKLILCDKLYRLLAKNTINSKYLVQLLRSSIARFQYERDATGASNSMQNIGQNTIKGLIIPLPSLIQQQEIANFLDQKTSEIDQQKAKIQEAIELLKEYRTALITNAVTGKIDVRQVPIP
jgi:type I restriction enzyme S subunit